MILSHVIPAPAFAGMMLLLVASAHAAEGKHAIALYGEPKYAEDFAHFDYVNAKAPKGGEVKLAEMGSFDSLNYYILNGVKAPGLKMLHESLLTSSQDEPQSMYGLIAERVAVAPDNTAAEFFLNPKARWHDGAPITPDDVVFSFHTLKEKGDPAYQILYTPIASVEKTGERAVKFTFADPKNRELPFIAGSMPVLPRHYYETHDFEKTTLEPPLGSGPYKIESVDPGRAIAYRRVEDYWAKDLAGNIGQNNFDVIRFDMYRDENVSLEAFKGGAYDFRQEYIARNWATAYDIAAVRDGRLIKRHIPDGRPQGMQAFLFNTRRPAFADARVREAIALTLDYEWLNQTIFYSAYQRNTSFFENTDFKATGKPEGTELALLEPFRAGLPAALFERQWQPPVTDGSGNAREQLLKAQQLLDEAGWKVRDGKRADPATGKPLSIEFLLRQPTMERVIGPMRKNLERLGITSSIRMIDDAQYQKRVDGRDFDVVSIWINRGVVFPGNEQTALWHSGQADVKGSNNLAGVKHKVVDALLDALVNARDLEALKAAGRALDRVLLWNHYVIPHWHSGNHRVAYWDKFAMPPAPPKYDLGLGAWWLKEAEKKAP